MSLPANFWDEFERRLDAKLDFRFTEFEKKIEKKFKKIDGWIERQDKAIEIELTHAVFRHFEEIKKGYYVIKPKNFPKKLNDEKGKEITDFDGIVILTNSKIVANIYDPEFIVQENYKEEANFRPSAYIIIVEAKQHITSNKFDKKKAQKEKIEGLLADIKSGGYLPPDHYKKYNLQLCEKNVGLYFGGSIFDEAAYDNIRTYAEQNELCGYVELNGTRFSVKDKTNNFSLQQFGGKKDKN